VIRCPRSDHANRCHHADIIRVSLKIWAIVYDTTKERPMILVRYYRLVDSAMVDSAMVDSAMVDSAMVDSAMVDSAMVDSAMVDSAMVDSAMTGEK
jgi:hypothetical protein